MTGRVASFLCRSAPWRDAFRDVTEEHRAQGALLQKRVDAGGGITACRSAQPGDHLAALVEIDDALRRQHFQHAATGMGRVAGVRAIEDRLDQRAQLRPELRLVAKVLSPGGDSIRQLRELEVDVAA